MKPTFLTTLILLLIAIPMTSCAPSAGLPSVLEPLDSEAWTRCSGEHKERGERETVPMIDGSSIICQGVVLAAQGEVEKGLELLTEASVKDKKDHRPHYLSGRILAEAGRYEEALSAFDRSRERYPSMEIPTERLGHSILEKRGEQEAISFLQHAERRQMCPYGCKGLLASLYKKTSDTEKAHALYTEMIKENEAEPAAYVGLASLHNVKAEYEEEATNLDKATWTANFRKLGDKQRADIFYSLAFARYNSGQFTAAAQAIEKAIDLRREQGDWYLLAGWIELKREKPDAAKRQFEKAQSLNATLAPAYTGQGDALMALNRSEKARAAYQTARGLDPTNSVIVLKLAYAVAVGGDLKEASRLLDEAIKLDKDNLPQELVEKITKLIEKK